MTEAEPLREEGAATAALVAAFDAFDSFRAELVDLLHEVKEGKTALARKLAPAITDLARALGTLLREYDRVQEERARHGDDVSKHALDLAEARDEIGRRMARLRAAGPAGQASGGPERT